MAANVITSPYSSILDLTGVGLTLGTVYIGGPNQDPQTNPQAVYWDQALTIPATQPLQVSAGYIMRSGSPSAVFTSGDYSIRALDHNGAQVFYRATSVIIPPVLPAARTLLTANTDLYVSTSGSDATGTGAIGAPWATIQKAFNVLQSSYDLAGYAVTIHVAAGSYAAGYMAAPIPGAISGPGAVLVSGAGVGLTIVQGATGNAAFGASGCGAFSVTNMTIGGGTGMYCLRAVGGGNIGVLNNVAFGSATQAQLVADTQGTITIAGSYSITGGSTAHYFAFGTGVIKSFGGPYVCTLIGTPNFSFGFAEASDNGFVSVQNTWMTFSGAATGPRYAVAGNATIDTFGSGANYFPGNSAGFQLTNGVYN